MWKVRRSLSIRCYGKSRGISGIHKMYRLWNLCKSLSDGRAGSCRQIKNIRNCEVLNSLKMDNKAGAVALNMIQKYSGCVLNATAPSFVKNIKEKCIWDLRRQT